MGHVSVPVCTSYVYALYMYLPHTDYMSTYCHTDTDMYLPTIYVCMSTHNIWMNTIYVQTYCITLYMHILLLFSH